MNELTPVPLPEYQPGPTYEGGPAPVSNFRLHKFLRFLLKFWWVPTLTVVLSVGAAVFYARQQPPIYVSSGAMWQTARLRLPETSLFSEDMENFLGTQSDLLRGAPLRARTLAALRAATNGVVIPKDANGDDLPVQIRVYQTGRSAVFVVEATSSQAAYTRVYLDTLMQVYLDYNNEIRKEISGITLDSITEQVQVAEEELKSQQDVLTTYERTNNLSILQEEGTVAGAYLTKLKTEISDLQLDEQLYEASLTNSATNGLDLAQTNLVVLTNLVVSSSTNLASTNGGNARSGLDLLSGNVPVEIQNKFKELEQLEKQYASLSTNFRDSHPKMVQLNADIERDRKDLDLYRRQQRAQVESARQTTRLKMENVSNSIAEWEDRVKNANYWIAESDRLRINVGRAQGQYDYLVNLMQNVKIGGKLDQETISIYDHASEAKTSHSAEISSIKTAVTLGLILGLGFIAWLTFRDQKFGSIFEVNERLGDAVIAQVPELPGLKGHLPLPEQGADAHTYAESYRCLRSALIFFGGETGRPRLLLVTSALPDEGKSTIAANLAYALAQGGARVLLVDADLRRGALHKLLGLRQEPGLSNLLQEPSDPDQAFQTNSLPNLAFLACGPRITNPGDRFLGPTLDQLLVRWRAQFDYVIIDSSPIFAADDATALAPKMDGTLLVVRNRYSNARQVRSALDMLGQRGARVLGVVFNRADASSHDYDYYKYANYYPAVGAPAPKTG